MECNFGKSVPGGTVFAVNGICPIAFGLGERREKYREDVENTQF
jgi:hypothetical protein